MTGWEPGPYAGRAYRDPRPYSLDAITTDTIDGRLPRVVDANPTAHRRPFGSGPYGDYHDTPPLNVAYERAAAAIATADEEEAGGDWRLRLQRRRQANKLRDIRSARARERR